MRPLHWIFPLLGALVVACASGARKEEGTGALGSRDAGVPKAVAASVDAARADPMSFATPDASSLSLDSGAVDDAGPAPAIDAGVDGAAKACVYPSGPYGLTQGSSLPPTLSWQGYVGGATQATMIAITDYFDCDGTKGINALDIDVGASYCPACNDEAPQVEQLLQGAWSQSGVRVLTLLMDDANLDPATIQTASDWIQQYSLTRTDVATDPNITFTVQYMPTNIVVDPRTMTITSLAAGFDPTEVSDLATSNAH